MIVAFEADELDATACTGWSVTVTRRASVVTEDDRAARFRAVQLTPWAPGARDQFVTISTELVEGQRISRTPATGGGQAAGSPVAGQG